VQLKKKLRNQKTQKKSRNRNRRLLLKLQFQQLSNLLQRLHLQPPWM